MMSRIRFAALAVGLLLSKPAFAEQACANAEEYTGSDGTANVKIDGEVVVVPDTNKYTGQFQYTRIALSGVDPRTGLDFTQTIMADCKTVEGHKGGMIALFHIRRHVDVNGQIMSIRDLTPYSRRKER